jgi:mycothiol system anti-sigma-R factor
MTCQEFEIALHAYVDGELSVSEMTAAEAHAADCRHCGPLARQEREFRQLLRRQPREAAPAALRASIRASLRRQARRSVVARPWLVVPALTAVAAALLVVALLPAFRSTPSLVAELVDKHIAYAQLERPAELASSDPAEIAEWFRARASLRVIVPDYSPAGIRLVGARIADADERKAAYLLYEKGHTLLSVFMLKSDRAEPSGRRVAFRGHDYVTAERKGYRTVAWADGQSLFGLVSSLDYDALLECADRLRAERARQTRI